MNNCQCGTVTTLVWVELYRAVQGLPFVVNCVAEIMGVSSCTFVLSKNGAKYMYFLLDKKNKVFTRFSF